MKYILSEEEAIQVNQKWRSENHAKHPIVLGWNSLAKTDADDVFLWQDIAFGCAVDHGSVSTSKSYAEKDGRRWRRMHSNMSTSWVELVGFASSKVHQSLGRYAKEEWDRLLVKSVLNSLIEQERFDEAVAWGGGLQVSELSRHQLASGTGVQGYLNKCEAWDQETSEKAEQALKTWMNFEDKIAIQSSLFYQERMVEPKGIKGCNWLLKHGLFSPKLAVSQLWGALYDLDVEKLNWFMEKHPDSAVLTPQLKGRTEFKADVQNPTGDLIMNQLLWGLQQEGHAPWEQNKDHERAVTKVVIDVIEWAGRPKTDADNVRKLHDGKPERSKERRLAFIAKALLPYCDFSKKGTPELTHFISELEFRALKNKHLSTANASGPKKHAL